MFGFKSKGWGFLALNFVRGINIIVLATIAVSSAVLMVVSKMPDGYTFFSDISLAFLITVCFFLGLSELGIWGAFFERNWPAFGPGRGLTWLGFSMIMMGSHTLGKLSDSRNSKENMGVIFWNLCMAAGILALIFGFVNVFMSWFFGKRLGRNVRVFRQNGATEPEEGWPQSDVYSSHSSGSVRKEKSRRTTLFGFGKKKPEISAPIAHHDMEKGMPLESRGSPIAPEIQRPPTLQHPAMRRGSMSHYSVASEITRFGGNDNHF
ncbi:hypothetical protein JX265_005048 [Neoarthrinium moseri]|uniref:DUF7598 domain-containing protein n=1 Tax=Neoarthrinium moseri TaxID=1658444 RepID=A0A9P9WPC5_9PEZI|nr:uncharacterized protein JN550_009228 [Neoarthrinium moseri]KAI1842722.1 hypothetical protein JX266_011043 [Neoarthrinium moseri]KAI1863949.1 hypothetical protein JN550_009228 [Neoarthrinium moseri]KAI1873426.1 hypothetical protein JX265_005048 [Neoarthrinium moseri]